MGNVKSTQKSDEEKKRPQIELPESKKDEDTKSASSEEVLILKEELKATHIELEKVKRQRDDLLREKEAMKQSFKDVLDIALEKERSLRIQLEESFKNDLASTVMKIQRKSVSCLQKICPNVPLDSSLTFEECLAAFESYASQTESSVLTVRRHEVKVPKTVGDKDVNQFETQRRGPNDKEGVMVPVLVFNPIKKAKSLGSLPKNSDESRNLKRKFKEIDSEEEKLRHDLLYPDKTQHDDACTICTELSKKCLMNPLNILLSYIECNSNKELVFILDTNIILREMVTVKLLLSTTIDEKLPYLLIPHIVVHELDNISKDKPNRNAQLAFQAREAAKDLEQVAQGNSRIIFQTLQQVKQCAVWKSKKKNNDDIITECCIGVQKSGYHAILYSDDRNIRIKNLGHRIHAFRTKDINEIISEKSINPLERRIISDHTMINILQMMKKVPDQLIQDMKKDHKNAINVLTGLSKHGNVYQSSEHQIPHGSSTRGTSDVDLDLSGLFLLNEEYEEKPALRMLPDGNYCVNDGDDDLYK